MDVYINKGSSSLKGILLFLFHGFIGGLIGALLVFLIEWKLNISLIILFPAFMGFTAGLGCVRGIKKGALRHNPTVMVLAVVLGIIVYFVPLFFKSIAWGLGFSELLSHLIREGFIIKRAAFAGVWVLIIWLIECIITVFICYSIASKQANKPYCSQCLTWADDYSGNVYSHINTKGALIDSIKNEEYQTFINAIAPVENEEVPRVELELHVCPDCDDFHYLSLLHHFKNEKGKERSENILQYVKIPLSLSKALREISPSDSREKG